VGVRVIIPTVEPGGLNANVYPHWKDAPTFTIIDVDDSSYNVVDVIKITDEMIIDAVRKYNVPAVLTLSLSIRALELLEKFNVKVYVGKSTQVTKLLEEFTNNRMFRVKICKCIGGIADFKTT